MRIKWNEVTWYSKLLALIIFILFPILGFYVGVTYERAELEARGAHFSTVQSPDENKRCEQGDYCGR